jgi:hypothetical protein
LRTARRRAARAHSGAVSEVLSVKELMQHIVHPQADLAFDAVIVDVGPKGVVETTPTTDEDWTRIERGMWVLAEASNLLKMPRKMARDGEGNHKRGKALKIVEIVKARDAQKLLDAGRRSTARARDVIWTSGIRAIARPCSPIGRAPRTSSRRRSKIGPVHGRRPSGRAQEGIRCAAEGRQFRS